MKRFRLNDNFLKEDFKRFNQVLFKLQFFKKEINVSPKNVLLTFDKVFRLLKLKSFSSFGILKKKQESGIEVMVLISSNLKKKNHFKYDDKNFNWEVDVIILRKNLILEFQKSHFIPFSDSVFVEVIIIDSFDILKSRKCQKYYEFYEDFSNETLVLYIMFEKILIFLSCVNLDFDTPYFIEIPAYRRVLAYISDQKSKGLSGNSNFIFFSLDIENLFFTFLQERLDLVVAISGEEDI
jgi:hypothetical protein